METEDLLQEEDYKTGFPDDTDSPKRKADPRWGLQVARAIWAYNHYHGNNLFYNNRDIYDELIDYALGRQNPDLAKPVTGINPEQAEQTWVRGVDWEVKNYATKRINIAVSKINARMSDPIATPISPRGHDIIGERKARIKAYMLTQEFQDEVSQTTKVNQTPFGIDPEKLPRDNEELEIFMELSDKPYVSMEIEKRVKHYLLRNNYDQLRNNMTWDGFVMGPICSHVSMGPNYNPEIKWIDPREMIVPPSNDPFFKDAPYFGRVLDWSISQLMKFKGEFTEDQWKDIVDNHTHTGQYHTDEHATTNTNINDEKTKRVRILHFEYSTNDQHVFVSAVDENGNKRLLKREHDKLKTPDQIKRFREKYGTTREFSRPGFETIYEGYWIVGTRYIFKWGRKNFSPKNVGNLGERLFGYKVIVPNMRSNTVISNMSQMKTVLKDLQRINAKLQQLLASEIPDGFAIDIDALRAAKLKLPGGKLMSDMEMIDMAIQSGIYVYAGKSRNNQGPPVTPTSNDRGSDKISKIMLMLQNSLRELDELIGFNEITSAQSAPKEKGARVSILQNQATDAALDHLFSALFYMDREVYRTLASLAVQQAKYGDKKVLVKTFGTTLNKIVGEETDVTKFDYGIDIQPRPTDQEWEQLEMDMREAMKGGQITMSQRVLLQQITNLKEAYAIMAIFEKRNRELAEQSKMNDVKANAEAQQASNQQTHNNAVELEQLKISSEKELKELEMVASRQQHKQKMAEIAAKSRLDSDGKIEQIRVQGDEDAQNAIVEGKAQEKVERVKAEVAPTPEPASTE